MASWRKGCCSWEAKGRMARKKERAPYSKEEPLDRGTKSTEVPALVPKTRTHGVGKNMRKARGIGYRTKKTVHM